MSTSDLSFLGVPEDMEEAIQSLHETRIRRIKRFMWHRRDEDLAAAKKRKEEAVEELEKKEEKRKAAKAAAEDPAPLLTVAASLLRSDSEEEEEEDVLPLPPGQMDATVQPRQGGVPEEGVAAASTAPASAAEPARQEPKLVASPPWRTPQSSAPTAPAASAPTASPPVLTPPAGSPPGVLPPVASSTSSTSRSSPTDPRPADAPAQQRAALAAQQQAALAAQQQTVAGEQRQVQRACRHGFVKWFEECAECRTLWYQLYWGQQQGGLCAHGLAVAQCYACSGTLQRHLLQQMKERQEAEQQQAQQFEMELQRREKQGRGAAEAAEQPAAFWQPESRPPMPSEHWQRAAPDPSRGFVARLVQAGEGGMPAWMRDTLPRGDERAREKAAPRNDRPKSQTICKSYCRHQGVEFPIGKCNWEATRGKRCEFQHPSDAVMEAAQRLMEQRTRGRQGPDDMYKAVEHVMEQQRATVPAPGLYAARHPETS